MDRDRGTLGVEPANKRGIMNRELLRAGKPKQVRVGRWCARLLCAAGLLGSGCGTKPDADVAVSPEAEPSLAALMEDGTLPVEMTGGPVGSVPFPRFCEDRSLDGSVDGGFPIPDMSGIAGSAAPPIGGGVAVPAPPMAEMGVAGSGVAAGAGGVPGTPMTLPGMMGGVGGSPAGGGTSGGGTSGGSAPDGGVAGMGGGTAGSGGGDIGDCSDDPIAFWRFDDCNANQTDFQDSSNQDHRSFRHVNQQCVQSQEGFGVAFARNDDLVYSPDQPDYGLDRGVTVAAWIKPDKIDATRTLFRKRDGNNSAFALLLNAKKFQFVIKLKNGKLASVEAPAKANRWTHVAATYDNSYLRLYLDGVEVRSARAEGTLAKGPGPLLIGNDASNRRVQGVMDNAWFNTLAAPADTIMELTCLHRPPTFTLSPVDGPAVPGGTVVEYTLSITSNNTAVCGPESLTLQGFGQELRVEPFFQNTPPIAPGQTLEVEFEVSSGEETEPDTYPFTIFSFDPNQGRVENSVQGTYTVAEPTGCHVTSSRELTVRHVSVVDDPIRTSMAGDPLDPRTGAWSFGRLMERLSPTAAAAPDVTEAMFGSFDTPQTVNGFTIEARPGMQRLVLGPWPRANGKLDLSRAPMRLLAIVNRLDLKDLAAGKAGEGRMVYGVLGGGPNGVELEFTVILEYLLPGSTESEYQDWVQQFHALQALPFPSEQYNAALQAITDRFTARNAMPSMPNGNLLIDIRTNEITLGGGQLGRQVWQLREFRISPTTGMLVPAPVFLTPDFSFNGSDRLARFINQNESTVLTERHDVPLIFEGEPFLGASVFNNIDFWSAPGVNDNDARHKFSLNTCNGCHGLETQSAFLQIFPRRPGQQSQLSGFLTGIIVQDPISGEPRRLAELARRRGLMEAIVCPEETP